ncbi:unnamed protein product [Linum trigynum]|uniref:Uncharacterized protein n=1 Tax=Linum trigynum TaxID=586398 RepID=A0AAV2DF82_9ROSI
MLGGEEQEPGADVGALVVRDEVEVGESGLPLERDAPDPGEPAGDDLRGDGVRSLGDSSRARTRSRTSSGKSVGSSEEMLRCCFGLRSMAEIPGGEMV